MPNLEIILLLTIIVIVILLFFLAKFKINDFRKKQKQRKRFERGNRLEAQAKYFLENKGYRILGEQKSFDHIYTVNGEVRSSKLIVDYIVKKNGKNYIVEVKTGKSAISLKDKNSRRQLLEYDFVIENDGIYLLDMENEKMQFVKFKTKAEKNDDTFRKVIIVIALIGIVIPSWKIKIAVGLIFLAIWFYPGKSRNVVATLHEYLNKLN